MHQQDISIVSSNSSTTKKESQNVDSASIYKCSECNKSLKNKQSLDYHITRSVCQKNKCTLCGTRFKSSQGLAYHTKNRICIPAERIKVNFRVKAQYHPYTVERKEITMRDVMNAAKLSNPESRFIDLIFNNPEHDMVISFLELALTNKHADHFWCCYVGNKREAFVNVYQEGEWVLKPKEREYDDLIDWAMEKINRYLNDNCQFMTDQGEGKKYWAQYLFHKDKLNNPKHRVRRDTRTYIHCMLINLKKHVLDKAKITGLKLRP